MPGTTTTTTTTTTTIDTAALQGTGARYGTTCERAHGTTDILVRSVNGIYLLPAAEGV